MEIENIICTVCGFRNPPTATRCSSCGAKLEVPLDEEIVAPAALEGFQWKWTMVSLGIFFALEAVLLLVLPLAIKTYDPQGMPAIMICVAIWFMGGLTMGFISPGRHFLEPAVAVAILVLPTIAYVAFVTPEGFDPSSTAYTVGGVLGVMSSMFGALMGERLKSLGRNPQVSQT